MEVAELLSLWERWPSGAWFQWHSSPSPRRPSGRTGESKFLTKQHWKAPGEVEGFTVCRTRGFPSLFCLCFFFLFPVQLVFSHSALSKMTRKKNSPQKKESETPTLSHRVTEFGLQFDVRKPMEKHNYKATDGSGKKA